MGGRVESRRKNKSLRRNFQKDQLLRGVVVLLIVRYGTRDLSLDAL